MVNNCRLPAHPRAVVARNQIAFNYLQAAAFTKRLPNRFQTLRPARWSHQTTNIPVTVPEQAFDDS
jgi:hypothetical protein